MNKSTILITIASLFAITFIFCMVFSVNPVITNSAWFIAILVGLVSFHDKQNQKTKTK